MIDGYNSRSETAKGLQRPEPVNVAPGAQGNSANGVPRDAEKLSYYSTVMCQKRAVKLPQRPRSG